MFHKSENTFSTALQENAAWLRPILLEMTGSSEKKEIETKEFTTENLNKIISGNTAPGEYETQPEQEICLTWIKTLDPKIDQQTKEKLCEELAQKLISDEDYKILTFSNMPSTITAPILLYSPQKILSSYYECRKKYGRYSSERKDKYFQTSLKFLANNKFFPDQAKTLFIKKLVRVFKQHAQQPYSFQDDPDYLLHQAMASWEKNSILTVISNQFDQELQLEYVKFKEKLQTSIEKPRNLTLKSKFDSLVFEKLLVKHKCDAEALISLAVTFGEDDIPILGKIYAAHGIDPYAMLSRHLVQIAKSTNESGHYEFSSLFFSSCFNYLKDKVKIPIQDIAAHLSPEYYAKHSYAFNRIRKEILTYWVKHKPKQIIAVVKAILEQPEENHTPIYNFFSDLWCSEMSDEFYNQMAFLLSSELHPADFIKIYSVVSENIQLKFLFALLTDEGKALAILKELSAVYQAGEFSLAFPGQISRQLRELYPKLYEQAISEKLIVAKCSEETLEADLHLLGKLLAMESLTHDKRRSEIHKLENLHNALNDEKTETCPAVIKMFETVPQKNWPDLFVYLDAQIIHWSFPHDEDYLKLLSSSKTKSPAPRKNTWLLHKAQWEDILYGTLVAILSDLSKEGLRSNIAHWALSALDQAFTKSSIYFPDMVESLLKRFFLEYAPNSIKIFIALYKKFMDKYHAPTYFSKENIYNKVASWLPEDIAVRTNILAELLIDGGFETALKTPFVRNKKELAQTALLLVNTRKEHFLNFLDRLSISTINVLFNTLYQFDKPGFLKLLQVTFSDLGKAELPLSNYLNFAHKLLSSSKDANINIFEIIDADTNKSLLLKVCSDIKSWEIIPRYLRRNDLIFSVVHHYQPELFQTVVFEHIQQSMKIDRLWTVCGIIEDAQKITGEKLVFKQPDEKVLVDFLKQEMPKLLKEYYPLKELRVMASVIPNLDELFLELMAKTIDDQAALSSSHEKCLDSLVEIYGFSHINTMSLDFKLSNCSKYLVEKFERFPEILRQTEKTIQLYSNLLNEKKDDGHNIELWPFFDRLRSTIMEAAKHCKSNSFEINVSEVCEEVGMTPELAKLMPPFTIKSYQSDGDFKKDTKVPEAKSFSRL